MTTEKPTYSTDPDSTEVRNPVNRETAERCLAYLAQTAAPLSVWKARRVFLERYVKTIWAVEANASGESSQTAKEREAYASPRYLEVIRELQEAQQHETMLIALRGAAESKFEAWRTLSATARVAANV